MSRKRAFFAVKQRKMASGPKMDFRSLFLSIQTRLFKQQVYYNPVRRHSALGYKSPDGFEKNHHQNQLNLQEPCPGK